MNEHSFCDTALLFVSKSGPPVLCTLECLLPVPWQIGVRHNEIVLVALRSATQLPSSGSACIDRIFLFIFVLMMLGWCRILCKPMQGKERWIMVPQTTASTATNMIVGETWLWAGGNKEHVLYRASPELVQFHLVPCILRLARALFGHLPFRMVLLHSRGPIERDIPESFLAGPHVYNACTKPRWTQLKILNNRKNRIL